MSSISQAKTKAAAAAARLLLLSGCLVISAEIFKLPKLVQRFCLSKFFGQPKEEEEQKDVERQVDVCQFAASRHFAAWFHFRSIVKSNEYEFQFQFQF